MNLKEKSRIIISARVINMKDGSKKIKVEYVLPVPTGKTYTTKDGIERQEFENAVRFEFVDFNDLEKKLPGASEIEKCQGLVGKRLVTVTKIEL